MGERDLELSPTGENEGDLFTTLLKRAAGVGCMIALEHAYTRGTARCQHRAGAGSGRGATLILSFYAKEGEEQQDLMARVEALGLLLRFA